MPEGLPKYFSVLEKAISNEIEEQERLLGSFETVWGNTSTLEDAIQEEVEHFDQQEVNIAQISNEEYEEQRLLLESFKKNKSSEKHPSKQQRKRLTQEKNSQEQLRNEVTLQDWSNLQNQVATTPTIPAPEPEVSTSEQEQVNPKEMDKSSQVETREPNSNGVYTLQYTNTDGTKILFRRTTTSPPTPNTCTSIEMPEKGAVEKILHEAEIHVKLEAIKKQLELQLEDIRRRRVMESTQPASEVTGLRTPNEMARDLGARPKTYRKNAGKAKKQPPTTANHQSEPVTTTDNGQAGTSNYYRPAGIETSRTQQRPKVTTGMGEI